jgi:hypothetical protein
MIQPTPTSTYLVVTYYPTHALNLHMHLPNNPLVPYLCTNRTIASTYIPSIHLLSYPCTKCCVSASLYLIRTYPLPTY